MFFRSRLDAAARGPGVGGIKHEEQIILLIKQL